MKKFCLLPTLLLLLSNSFASTITHAEFISALGGQKAYENLPILTIANSRSTAPEKMIAPIMKGITPNGRTMVVIKYVSSTAFTTTETLTFYTDTDEASGNTIWVTDDHPYNTIVPYNTRAGLEVPLTETAIENLAKLVKGETITVDSGISESPYVTRLFNNKEQTWGDYISSFLPC